MIKCLWNSFWCCAFLLTLHLHCLKWAVGGKKKRKQQNWKTRIILTWTTSTFNFAYMPASTEQKLHYRTYRSRDRTYSTKWSFVEVSVIGILETCISVLFFNRTIYLLVSQMNGLTSENINGYAATKYWNEEMKHGEQ